VRYFLSFIIFFLVLEVCSRIFFKQFNYNSIFYQIDNNHRVIKGIDTFLYSDKTSDSFLYRVLEKDTELKLSEDKKKIIFVGDSVTMGYGVEFKDAYFQKFFSNLDIENTQVVSASNLGINFNPVYEMVSKKFVKKLTIDDTLIYQFNYNDIIPFDKIDQNFINNSKSKYYKVKLFNYLQKIKFKYLNYSSFIKTLNHYASLQFKNLKGSCEQRKIESLGQYTYSYFSKGFEKESQLMWNAFEKNLIQLKKILDRKNINFYVLISPISLQLKNHESVNKLRRDMNCSTNNAHEYLKKILIKNNIEYIDPIKNFIASENQDSKILFHEFDTNHPNSLGHKLIADALLEKF